MDSYIVTSHSSLYVLDMLKNNRIKIENFTIIDQYTFSFSSSILNRKKIRKIFPSIRLVNSKGILYLLLSLWTNKIVLLSLILSMMFYSYLSSFIWRVDINGNNEYINSLIYDELKNSNIVKGNRFVDNAKLELIEHNIYESLKSNIEWLEIKRSGCVIDVSYLKRRQGIEEIPSKGPMYASKDAIIYRIEVDSGNVLVKENQFVKQGTLLVDDKIEISSGGLEFVPTKGRVIGITWYVIDIEVNKFNNDDGEIFEFALSKGRDELNNKVTNIINVRSQNLLKYENESSIIRVRIHYEVLEDISKGD